MQYRREIDGLRALAVIPVILFHAGFSAFGGGFVGVDVFFVISGFLITSIILAEKATGRFSLLKFYERRARRILPALFLVMGVCTLLAIVLLAPFSGRDFYQSLAATALFSSNILFIVESDNYFGLMSEYKPLLHTCSLAVEEQFYVVYPVFLLLAWRLGRKRTITLISLLAILSIVGAHWGSLTMPAPAFYLLPTRGWELLCGALLAYLNAGTTTAGIRPWLSQAGSTAGLLLMGFAVFAFDKNTPYPGLFALVPTIGAALVIAFATPETVVGKLLASRPFVGVGLVSYSTYLWHQPLFAFARHLEMNEPGNTMLLSLSVLSLLLGYASWALVEKPFRNRNQTSARTIAVCGGIGSILFVAIGFAGHLTTGFQEQKLSRLTDQRRALFVDQYREVPRKQAVREQVEHASKVNWPDRKILILGDSMSIDMKLAVDLNAELFPGVQFSTYGLDDACMGEYLVAMSVEGRIARAPRCERAPNTDKVAAAIAAADEVVLAAAWKPDTESIAIDMARHINGVHKKAYIVDAFRIFHMSDSSYYFAASGLDMSQLPGFMYQRLLPSFLEVRKGFLRDIAPLSTIVFIDKLGFFCNTSANTCSLYDNAGLPLFHDELHVTVEGARKYGRALHDRGYFAK